MYSNTDFSLSSLYDNFVPDYDIDCINSFKSKLFILPYGNSEICYSIYKDIKYQFGSDIIIFFPTNNIFIMINQVRDGGKTFTGVQLYKEPCGMAPNFYSSIIVRFGTRKFTLGDDLVVLNGDIGCIE